MSASSPAPPPAGRGSTSRDGLISSSTLTSRDGASNSAVRSRTPRTLPPWVNSYEPRHGSATDEQFRLLSTPPRTLRPQHNSTPEEPRRRVSRDGFVDTEDDRLGPGREPMSKVGHLFKHGGRGSLHGRKWDHLRTHEPVIVPQSTRVHPSIQHPMAWKDFLHSSAWGHGANEKSEIVDPEMLNQLQPHFNDPLEEPVNPLDKEQQSKRRRTLNRSTRVWHIVMRHKLSPLLFRLTVVVTSILSLGLASRVFKLGSPDDQVYDSEQAQSVVAITVDCVAIPYILYMIWDEYTGRPVGLRSARNKMSLILLDLFFIIFKSSSTALAFESIVYHTNEEIHARALAKGLAAFQLVGLIAWSMTFTVNIFRTVDRLGAGDDYDV